MSIEIEKSYCFDDFTLDLRRGCLRAGDRDIELRPKSFEALRYLVENAGRLVPKDELIKAVWPKIVVSDESLARCVSDIRVALGDNRQNIIKTVPRRGYLFASAASVAAQGGQELQDTTAATAAASELMTPPRFSLVVLPFVNLSGDSEHDFLADVITDGITMYLSRMRDAFVIARTTAATYKGRATDIRKVGQELGIRYALEGSVQVAGPLARVSAQLIDVESGAHLWADRFDANHSDRLQMQDYVITRLARALQIELMRVESGRIAHDVLTKPGAEELSLRGEAIFSRYGPSRAEAEEAFTLCERALEINHDDVRALSILTEKYATRVTGMQSTNRSADIAMAEQYASRALALDPNSYHAHHARARVLIAQKRAEEALIEAEHSLRLNPSFIPTYLDLCQANLMLGFGEKTIEHAATAMRLSPPDPYLYVFYAQEGLGHIMLGQDALAVASLRRAVANNPYFPSPFAYLTAALALSGQDDEARSVLKQYLSLGATKTKTITDWKAMSYSDHPVYLAFRERIHDGLRKAGMVED
jgi:adenylate cyclase